MPSRSSKSKLIDVREERNPANCTMRPGKVELREDRNGDLHLTGYASTFDEYEVYGGPENYGWIERIAPQAFDRTMAENPDLHLLINHDGMPLARTKSGTLTLSVDGRGLKVDALLDKTDPDVQALVPKMLRGDMDEMSFAFRVKENTWSAAPGFEDDPMSYRLITELSLQRGDVSVVNFGANPHTSAELTTVGQAVGFLANADPNELRNEQLDGEELRRAQKVLARMFRGGQTKRDSDEDPGTLLQGLDATLDEMCDIVDDIDVETESEDVGQLCALTGTADATVDQLMDLMDVYDADDDNNRSQHLAAFGVRARRAGRTDLPRPRRRIPKLPATRAARVGTIAQGLRIEVDDADAVRVFDASGLLDKAICTVIASEVRAAVEGKRKAVTSSRTPAASSGDAMSIAEGKQLIGQTISVDSAREETGETATISLKDAKAEAS